MDNQNEVDYERLNEILTWLHADCGLIGDDFADTFERHINYVKTCEITRKTIEDFNLAAKNRNNEGAIRYCQEFKKATESFSALYKYSEGFLYHEKYRPKDIAHNRWKLLFHHLSIPDVCDALGLLAAKLTLHKESGDLAMLKNADLKDKDTAGKYCDNAIAAIDRIVWKLRDAENPEPRKKPKAGRSTNVAQDVERVLRAATDRGEYGLTKKKVAKLAGCHPSSLSKSKNKNAYEFYESYKKESTRFRKTGTSVKNARTGQSEAYYKDEK